MVTISGIKFPTTGNIRNAPKNGLVLAYTKATRDGKSKASKIIKKTIKR